MIGFAPINVVRWKSILKPWHKRAENIEPDWKAIMKMRETLQCPI
jgi:hypothetical protein